MKPVGEIEFVNGTAAMSASGQYGKSRLCAGIVGHADLRLGDGVARVLEAEIAAGDGASAIRWSGALVRCSRAAAQTRRRARWPMRLGGPGLLGWRR